MLTYLATVRVWLGDDGADAAQTMAALDKYLRRAEALAELGPLGRRRGDAAPAAENA
jgi:hypothetical protein